MANPAETYEAEMVPAMFGPWVPVLLDAAQPRPGERVVDLACGTGIVARHAARAVGDAGEVVGLDLSPKMLDVARSAADREGLSIEWHEGNLESLPCADEEFDVAFCQHGLQFVPDKPKALAEMHRVLRTGGRVALSVWRGLDLHPLLSQFNDSIVRNIGIPALAAPFSLSDPGEIRGLLEGAGFANISIEPKDMLATFPDANGFIDLEVEVITAAIPSVQHLDTTARSELATAITKDMSDAVRAATNDGHVEMRMHAYIVRADRP